MRTESDTCRKPITPAEPEDVEGQLGDANGYFLARMGERLGVRAAG